MNNINAIYVSDKTELTYCKSCFDFMLFPLDLESQDSNGLKQCFLCSWLCVRELNIKRVLYMVQPLTCIYKQSRLTTPWVELANNTNKDCQFFEQPVTIN